MKKINNNASIKKTYLENPSDKIDDDFNSLVLMMKVELFGMLFLLFFDLFMKFL